MKKSILILFFILLFSCSLYPQFTEPVNESSSSELSGVTFQGDTTGKVPLNHSLYNLWEKIDNSMISPDGKWVSYELNPGKGDGNLILVNLFNKKSDTIKRGYDAVFSPNSDFIAFKIKPPEDSTRKAKLEKKKKEQMPKDSFGVVSFLNLGGKELFIDSYFKSGNLVSFKVPEENASWTAFTLENSKNKKDTASRSNIKTYEFIVLNPVTSKKFEFADVSDFSFSKNGSKLGFITLKKGKNDTSSVTLFDTREQKEKEIFKSQGYIKNISLDDKGTQSAFIYSPDTAEVKRYGLFYWSAAENKVRKIADMNSTGIPYDWEISEHANLNFSEDGTMLYFGTAPKILQPPKDTIPDDEIAKLDVWHWDDPLLQTQQIHELEKEKKRNYRAVYHLTDKTDVVNRIVQLEDKTLETVRTSLKGNGKYAAGISYKPYLKMQSWCDPEYSDIYSVNVLTGERKLIFEKARYRAWISSGGNYILWFNTDDSSYYSYSNINNEYYQLTKSIHLQFCDELWDMPNPPEPYGIGGWIQNDSYVLIYDRFDIWKFSPDNSELPVKLTEGRESQTRYRYIKLDPEEIFIKKDETILLKSFNEDNYSEGYYSLIVDSGELPKKLILQDYHFSGLKKSKKADKIIWQKCTYTEFNNIWNSNIDFSGQEKISDANPQQTKYLWGTAELVKWKGPNNEDMRGILYKPENFNPENKYPMIVYFYEKYTDRINYYYPVAPSRSVINFPLYNSNGYVIFLPDISYDIGYPGESALKYVMSGTAYVISLGFIDENNVGLQGQSWGGYQVAYIVTQTNFYKCAMAGAPVANMTSAYGGIRLESGIVRSHQYEDTQSRIGVTLWDSLSLYIKNSPLFFADKISTPLLIMANDADGAVPWQQGIEFFNALRRLDKKVWMLTYNDDQHNLTKWPNRVDLSIRMKQFFDHFLKGEAMPKWMSEGIPAINKGIDKGLNN